MEVDPVFGKLLEMRVLIALSGADIPNATETVAEIAAEHQVVIAHDSDGSGRHVLELALRNALPERDVVTVLTHVVVSADDPAFATPSAAPSPDPAAIAELRSVRTLLDAGAVVICAYGGGSATVVGEDATMRRVEAVVDRDLTAALLARRLDVDLFLALGDAASDATGAKEEAARRFIQATGRRAAVAAVTDAVPIVRGAAGTGIATQRA